MDNKRKKQEKLLAELESIKVLLDSDPLDNEAFAGSRQQLAASDPAIISVKEIPTLNEMILEDDPLKDPIIKHLVPQNTTLNTTLPGQQPLFEQAKTSKQKEAADKAESEIKTSYNIARQKDREDTLKSSNDNSTDSATENPFLPQHIRERLTKPSDLKAILAGNANKRFLLPPIVKTTVDNDSLDQRRFFSTNSFLDSIRADSSNTQSLESALNQIPPNKDSSLSKLESESSKAILEPESNGVINLLIDDLVAQYLPEIEAKLRFQLKESLTHKPQKK
jgi:hypothetical protein